MASLCSAKRTPPLDAARELHVLQNEVKESPSLNAAFVSQYSGSRTESKLHSSWLVPWNQCRGLTASRKVLSRSEGVQITLSCNIAG